MRFMNAVISPLLSEPDLPSRYCCFASVTAFSNCSSSRLNIFASLRDFSMTLSEKGSSTVSSSLRLLSGSASLFNISISVSAAFSFRLRKPFFFPVEPATEVENPAASLSGKLAGSA
eukprot:CAMPEP_0185769662 /NCGR_PEP_ID=MMETSP1174-20130828/55261_1 /TAXON_ID=35687 /ORGANISM="Dictyocha speculum, Strain CCMP1381" /LENGTH=116 /DNA_ID=CAMNT_0028454815 /DNA_START=325 /DNA_END=672 /DNA_ORIENTATION=-